MILKDYGSSEIQRQDLSIRYWFLSIVHCQAHVVPRWDVDCDTSSKSLGRQCGRRVKTSVRLQPRQLRGPVVLAEEHHVLGRGTSLIGGHPGAQA